MTNHPFRFDRRLTRWSRPFGVRPANSTVAVLGDRLTATFGPWTITTEVANIVSVSTTGPYRRWRVAGPARLSIVDRGVTFATNTDQGLCITFDRAVPGIEPFGLITHKALTVTVDRPSDLADALGFHGELSHSDLSHGSFISVARALVRSFDRRRSVVVAPPIGEQQLPDEVDLPEVGAVADEQAIDSGVGPWFHRRYTVDIADASLNPRELIDEIKADPNVISDTTFAPFVKDDGRAGDMAVGDRYTVRTAGPWEGPVEVIDVGRDHFRFATLDGHMEAGVIDMHATAHGDLVRFEIESWARSGDRAFHVLYDVIGVAKSVQTEMWVSACERAASRAGGRAVGPVEVSETRTPPNVVDAI